MTGFVDWLINMGYLDKEDVEDFRDREEIEKDLLVVKRHAPKMFNLLMTMCGSDARAYPHDNISKVNAIVDDIIELLPKEPGRHESYWASGNEILADTQYEADTIADLFDQLYGEGTVNTGYYDPEEDERMNEVDKYTGWYYVNFE